ncbi:MAG: BrnT family toxin [Terriglobia bacterium]
MRYEWDEEKNQRNRRKHGGISFELAALVFEDERCLVGPDRVDRAGEQRWHAIGEVRIDPEGAAVLLVVHAYRENCHGEEVIRIISARRAEKHEIRRYQEQAMD